MNQYNLYFLLFFYFIALEIEKQVTTITTHSERLVFINKYCRRLNKINLRQTYDILRQGGFVVGKKRYFDFLMIDLHIVKCLS